MENMSWIIPTVAVVISSGALWFRITKQAVIIATKIATKEDLDKHRAETKEDFERLRSDFDKLRLDFENHCIATKEDFEKHRAATKEDFDKLRLDVEKYRSETNEGLDKLRSEMKSEHAELARKVESLNNHFIDHLSFHAERSD